jgi:hypothetical protein
MFHYDASELAVICERTTVRFSYDDARLHRLKRRSTRSSSEALLISCLIAENILFPGFRARGSKFDFACLSITKGKLR